jgi:hypothetical protein
MEIAKHSKPNQAMQSLILCLVRPRKSDRREAEITDNYREAARESI